MNPCSHDAAIFLSTFLSTGKIWKQIRIIKKKLWLPKKSGCGECESGDNYLWNELMLPEVLQEGEEGDEWTEVCVGFVCVCPCMCSVCVRIGSRLGDSGLD